MGVREWMDSCGCFADGGRPPASLGVWDVYPRAMRFSGFWAAARAIEILYDTSVAAVIVFCVATQLLSGTYIPFCGSSGSPPTSGRAQFPRVMSMTEISVSLASRLWMACKPTVKFGVLV